MGCLTLSAQAATIAYNFDGANASATTNDFGSGVTADDVVLANTGEGKMTLAEDRAHRKLRDPSIGTLAITVNIPNGVVVDLTALDFIDGADSGTGGNDTFSQWDLAVSTGSASPNSGTDFVAGTGFSSSPNSVTLSGLTGLTNTSVTFTWTVNYGVTSDFSGGGNHSSRHAFLDDIVITGSVVPEPTTTALLGLGGLALILRRRK